MFTAHTLLSRAERVELERLRAVVKQQTELLKEAAAHHRQLYVEADMARSMVALMEALVEQKDRDNRRLAEIARKAEGERDLLESELEVLRNGLTWFENGAER